MTYDDFMALIIYSAPDCRVIKGQIVLDLLMIAVLLRGHILLEGPQARPSTGWPYLCQRG